MLSFIVNILNSIFTFLDRVVYGLITILYQLLLYLANLDLFGMSEVATGNSENVIVQLSSRIYAFLGIFMLFKVGFSILQYMVNPDDFSDKGKGFGKLVTNVMVALVLIITVPSIFEKAFELQGIILEENVIGTLILGNTTSADSLSDPTNEELAEDLQFLIYGVFFSVDTDVISSCSTSPILGTRAMAQNTECLSDLADALEDYGGEEKLGEFFSIENDGESMRNFDAFGDVVNAKVDDEYVFNYTPISILAGGFVVVMLLSFCMDVAVRVIKLGFLEIISPIPIVSYIDPKQSTKDGMLGKWARECLSTYLSLFIRLAIIYFTFFVIQLVANDVLADSGGQVYLNGDSPSGLMAGVVQIMIILGVLLFAKEVPKLIEKIFGIESAGNLSINPLKKINESPLASAAVGGIAGGVIGLAGAATGSGVSRGLTGAVGGMVGGLNGKKLGEITAAQADKNRELGIAKAEGSTLFGRMRARASTALGTPGKTGNLLKDIREVEVAKQQTESAIAERRAAIAKREATRNSLDEMRNRAVKKIQEGNGKQGQRYQYLMREAAAYEGAGNGARAEAIRQDAQAYLYGEGTDSWVTTNLKSDDGDVVLKQLYEKAEVNAKLSGHDDKLSMDGKALDNLSKNISAEIHATQVEIMPSEQQIKDYDDKIKEMQDSDEMRAAKADVQAVHGKEGGVRRPGRFGGPRP